MSDIIEDNIVRVPLGKRLRTSVRTSGSFRLAAQLANLVQPKPERIDTFYVLPHAGPTKVFQRPFPKCMIVFI